MTAQPIDPGVSGMWCRYELVADSVEELIVTKPFDVRLPVRDLTP
ncbi:hypothetical protein SAMN05443287_105144 [Micromonospora phaseoli]|uniref:Uncharacterized protein n=1 Tax=Micromonospora phaseoli TaxID=1144548 RepID=A0A1H6ZVS2_9ACTN|nr:hypothetical protein [Micromonospora phaseoli]PZV97160.1 hypothetical protein CLV64_106269 [Micromonospora phaseoli]GIJ77260.1 hypothetical protein Xph01_16920 [Micromonospora phaseoli]SEJ53690.1 hypothetical protein SAMN05443287_105144 [Micromonospora phaseoli]